MVPEEDRSLQERQRAELPHQVGFAEGLLSPFRPVPLPFGCPSLMVSSSSSAVSVGRTAWLCAPSSTDIDPTSSTTPN